MRLLSRLLSKAALSAIPLLAVVSSQARAQDCGPACCQSCCQTCCEEPSCRRLYVGFFGGVGGSSNVHATQQGVALFPNGGPPDGLGALVVNATGSVNGQTSGLGGIQIGREGEALGS